MKKYSISNSNYLRSPKGFTLMELLTVMGVLGVIGSIVVSLLVITFRGMKKLDSIEYARQNGDLALSQIIRSVRYAARLDNPSSYLTPTTSSSITIISLLDYAKATYSCEANTIASNGASLIDNETIKVSSCSFYCSQLTDYQPQIITVNYVLIPSST